MSSTAGILPPAGGSKVLLTLSLHHAHLGLQLYSKHLSMAVLQVSLCAHF